MVDHRRDAARRAAGGVQPEARRAGIEHAAKTIRAAFVRAANGTRTATARGADSARRELLDDDLNEALQVERLHQGCGGVRGRAPWRACGYNAASRIGVPRKMSTISSASGVDTSVDPSASTLAPLCSRA